MALRTYAATFTNNFQIPIKISYKTVQPGSTDLSNLTTRTVRVVNPEAKATVYDLNVDLPLRVLVQPQYTRYFNQTLGGVEIPNYNWDKMNAVTKLPDATGIPVVADGAWIFVPASVMDKEQATEVIQGIFSFTYSVTGKPTPANSTIIGPAQVVLSGSLICGRWFRDCPGSLNGVQVDTCTGFQSLTGRNVCQNWCDYTDAATGTKPNAAACDAIKEWICTGQDNTTTYKTSPECVCISKTESQVKFPYLSDMTYSELIAALNKSPGWSLGASPTECWFPGCTSTDALKTTAMATVMNNCPTPPTQICAVSVGQIIFDNSSANNNVELLNCCIQSTVAAAPPVPAPPAAAPTPGKPRPSAPGSTPTPTPVPVPVPVPVPTPPTPEASKGLSLAAIIGIVVAAVVVIIIVVVVVVVAMKPRPVQISAK